MLSAKQCSAMAAAPSALCCRIYYAMRAMLLLPLAARYDATPALMLRFSPMPPLAVFAIFHDWRLMPARRHAAFCAAAA